MRGRWLLAVGVFVALAWGVSFLLIKHSLAVTAPFGVALGRIALGAAVLNLVPAARARIPLREHGPLVLLAVVWMGAPMVLFPLAETHLDSSVAGMINGSAPLWTAAIAAAVSRRLPSRGRVLGLAVGFAGVALIALRGGGGRGGSSAWSVVFVVLAVFCYGIAFNLTGGLQRRYGALPVVARSMAIATVLLLPLGLPDLVHAGPDVAGVVSLVLLGLVSTGAAFAAFTWLSGQLDPTRAAVVTYAVPVVAALAGVVAGETLAPLAVVGIPLVLLGAWIVQRSRLAPAPRGAGEPMAGARRPRLWSGHG